MWRDNKETFIIDSDKVDNKINSKIYGQFLEHIYHSVVDEFLHLCHKLNAEQLIVLNCGLTDGDEKFLKEALFKNRRI